MRKFTAAIFDLGLTLIYSPRVENFIKVGKMLGIEMDEDQVKRALTFTDGYFMKNRPGILSQEPIKFYMEFLGIMFAYLHLDPDIKEFHDTLFRNHPPRKEWRLYDETIPFLEKLKNTGMKIGLLSNWDLSAKEILDKLGLTKYFDSIVISSEIGIEKPAREAFLHSLKDLGVGAGEAFYVGDNFYDDVKGGNQAGLKVFLINHTGAERTYENGGTADFVEIDSLMAIFNYLNGVK